MKLAVSILNIKEPKNLEVTKFNYLDVDFIHLDVMDGIFVENKTPGYLEFNDILSNTTKDIDVHLMVSDVKRYIDDFAKLNPRYITFHYEAVSEIASVISYIKEKNIKVGISIKPNTDVGEIVKYLEYVDLVLVMSVEPGRGGQQFILDTTNKIKQLYDIRKEKNYNYLIEVDGGINLDTINECNLADICVVGSYITSQNYGEAINKLRD